eukprot:gene10628-7561_t
MSWYGGVGLAVVVLLLAASWSHAVSTSLQKFYESQCVGTRSPRPGQWSCAVHTIKVKDLSMTVLLDALESTAFAPLHEAFRKKFERYYIVMPIEAVKTLLKSHTDTPVMHNKGTTATVVSAVGQPPDALQQLNSILDDFVTVHPWWTIRQYLSHHHAKGSGGAAASASHHSSFRPLAHDTVIFERVPQDIEALARSMLAQSFPATCDNRTLYVKTSIGSWGNDIIVNMENYVSRVPEAVHLLYVTRTGDAADYSGYVEPQGTAHCANQINKQLCAFLPTSNCSVPWALQKCHQSEACIVEGHYAPEAKARTHVYAREDPIKHRQEWTTFFDVNLTHRSHAVPILKIGPHLSLGIVPDNIDATEQRDDVSQRFHPLFLMFHQVYRPNHWLGSHIQAVLEEFFDGAAASPWALDNGGGSSSTNTTSTSTSSHEAHHGKLISRTMDRSYRCHVAHIRMGDRYINRSTNMFEWCAAHTNRSAAHPDERAIGEWIDGRPLSMGQWHDMGCQARNPFGTLTLQHYVNASIALNPNVTHLMVLTDDYRWLNEELAVYRKHGAYREQVTLHIFPTHLDNVHRSRNTMQATAEWWAGVQAARQCDAFIGHTASAASFSFYRAMCYQHRDQNMQCPPWFLFN